MGQVIDVKSLSECDIAQIISYIKEEKVIIMPCDTIYGFTAVSSQESRVRQIKQRDDKPFIYLISDIDMLSFFDIDSACYADILQKNWPGNITFIMNNRSGTSSFGVRMPSVPNLVSIIRAVGQPLLSTSVNVSGQQTLNDPNAIIDCFADITDLIVIEEQYVPLSPSTIVDLTCTPHRIIRQGDKIYETNQ